MNSLKITPAHSLCGLGAVIISLTLAAGIAAAQPTTTKTTTKTGSSTATREARGTVLVVDGNNLVIRMDDGEIRHVVAPENARAIIDGKEYSARQLRPGTKLKATYTTETTSVMERTTTVGSGKVFFVSGPNVILTLPNGENRQYKVKSDYKFTVNGQPATVFDLRKGMTVSAEKIVEEPKTIVSQNTVITGEFPAAPKPERTEIAAAPPRPAPAPSAAPAPPPEPAPEPAPTRLPKTASPLPLIGFAGALLTALSIALRRS
jgi:hypothetical protein